MAWSFVGHRGSANNKVSGPALSVAPNQIIPVGAVVIAVGIADNIANASNTNHHVLVDTKQNAWQKVGERTNAAAAGAGITLSLWVSQLATALMTTDAVMLGLTAAATSKALSLYEYAIGAGNLFRVVNVAASEQDGTANPTVTLNSLASDAYALFGVVAREDDTASTYTMDADYNDRTKFGTTGGTAATNVSAIVGDRVATLASDIFAPTGLSVAADCVTALFALQEIVPVSLTCTKVYQPGTGKVYVNWSDGVQDEFASLQQAKDATAILTKETLRALAIARYLNADPTAATPSILEGHAISYSPSLNRMVEVF